VKEEEKQQMKEALEEVTKLKELLQVQHIIHCH